MSKTRIISIRVSDSLYEYFAREARKDDRPVSSFVLRHAKLSLGMVSDPEPLPEDEAEEVGAPAPVPVSQPHSSGNGRARTFMDQATLGPQVTGPEEDPPWD
jgi:hypothetical protein